MIPSIGKALSIPTNRQQMISSTYSVASGASMLLWGRLADVHGRRSIFLIGALLFTLATFTAPFSTNEWVFYLFRVLQGLSSAATVPSAIGIMSSTFPPGKDRTRAFVSFTGSAAVGSVLGNIAGGAIGGSLSWRWVFWIPAALAALIAAVASGLFSTMPHTVQTPIEDRAESGSINTDQARDNHRKDTIIKKSYVDYIGGFQISIALVLLQVGLSQGNVDGWANWYVPVLVGCAVVLGGAFVRRQLGMECETTRQPLVRLSMFRNAGFLPSFIVVACFYASYNGFLIFASFFYQDILGFTELETTLRFLPAGIVGCLVCFAVAPALSYFRGFHILLFGILCGIISPLLFALPTPFATTPFSYWAHGFPAMCLCLSADLVWPVIGLHIARTIPEAHQSLAGALLQAVNQVGRGLGMALGTAVQAICIKLSADSEKLDLLHGLQGAQWSNVGLATLSLVISLIYLRDIGRD
ncbi:drug resistance protein [Annulohypoxylon moriforme]|nr:drug resistance protein [Annulohypoxylon moriforme]